MYRYRIMYPYYRKEKARNEVPRTKDTSLVFVLISKRSLECRNRYDLDSRIILVRAR